MNVDDPVVFRDMYGKDHAAKITNIREDDRVDVTFTLGRDGQCATTGMPFSAKPMAVRNIPRAGDEPERMTWRLP